MYTDRADTSGNRASNSEGESTSQSGQSSRSYNQYAPPTATDPRGDSRTAGGGNSTELCDPRLHKLDIGYWTNVSIDNATAAKCISMYLETDHPLLGHFNPDLFVSDLTSKRRQYCSSLLVNSLLYWACVGLSESSSHLSDGAMG